MNLRLLAIGVSRHDDPGIGTLTPCDPEAQRVFDLLVDPTYGYAKAAESVLLTSANRGNGSSRAAILSHLQRLCTMSAADEGLVVYFSGHGTTIGDDGYIVCSDSRTAIIPDTAIRVADMSRMLRGATARFKVLILDCCKPGYLVGKDGDAQMTEAFEKSLEAIQAEMGDEGLIIMMSCKGQQVSNVLADGSGSVYTHFLIKALEGDLQSPGGEITVGDLQAHLLDRVRTWSLHNQAQQVPRVVADLTGDMGKVALARVRPGLVAQPPARRVRLSHIRCEGAREFPYPRKLSYVEPPTPGQVLVNYGIGPRPVTEVDRERTREAASKAEEYAREMRGILGAIFVEAFDADALSAKESEVHFPGGYYYVSESSYGATDAAPVKCLIHLDAGSAALLAVLRKRLPVQTVTLRLESGEDLDLVGLVQACKRKGVPITAYEPGRRVALKLKSLGQRGESAALEVRREKASWDVAFGLGTIDADVDASALVEVALSLFEGW